MKPEPMQAVFGGLRYDTEKASLIASDAYWDGHNWERRGRNRFLFRTKKGRYFVQYRTQWQGEFDRLEPVSQDEAIRLWESELPEHEVAFEEAFPGVTLDQILEAVLNDRTRHPRPPAILPFRIRSPLSNGMAGL